MLSRAILLGPQRHVPIVRPALDSLLTDRRQPAAAVTAGWEEREAEDQELRDHVGRPVVNLEVWRRVERICTADPELFGAIRDRQQALRRVQELYRLRLGGLVDAARELLRRGDGDALLDAERSDAIGMLQTLDSQHVSRVAAIHAEFESRWRPAERRAVARERREIERLLAGAGCLLIAGGHIAVLLHRLRLFDLLGLWGDRPLIAWSAGAMALCERIVLFHDKPPQGSSHAEVMEAGLGLVPRVVALPHARRRLSLDDPLHLQLMARRFEPAFCALLDDGTRFEWRNGQWLGASGSRRLTVAGRAEEVGS